MPLYALIASFVRRHWRAYSVAGMMLATVAVLTVVVPRVVGSVVDGLARGDLAGPALVQKLGLLLLCGIGIYFLRVGWRLQLFAASYKLGVELRTQLYARLCLQGPSFFQQQRTGDLMALATNDVDAVEMAAGEAMLAGFDGTLTLIMVVAMMTLGVDWRLAVVALLPFPFMAVAFWHISEQIHLASRDSLERFSRLNDHVQETLSGVRTLRALGLEERSAATFADLTASAVEANLRAQRWEAAYEPVVGTSLVLASGLTLSLGGHFVWQDQLSVGALVAFNLYLGQLIWPMFAAGWVLSLMERLSNTEGVGAIVLSDLARAIKRLTPRRIIVGEVRGPEVIDMLEAMTQGISGSMCTIHADSSYSVFPRLPVYARASGRCTR